MKLLRSALKIQVLLLAAIGATYASPLPTVAGSFNVFTFGNFSDNCCDVGGRLAVGGNASVVSYGFGVAQAPDSGRTDNGVYSLVVNGSLSGMANIFHGNAYVGTTSGTIYFQSGNPDSTITHNPTTAASLGVDFASIQTTLQLYSNFLATQANASNTGTVTQAYSTVTVVATHSGTNYVNLTPAQLGGSNTINIYNDGTNGSIAGSTLVINVVGTGFTTTNAQISINGIGVSDTNAGAQRVLFNFPSATSTATSFTLGGSMPASILAPFSNVTGTNNLQVDGNFIASTFTGNTEFHDLLFDGNLPSQTVTTTPEPVSMSLIGSGLLILFGIQRKKRKI